LKQQFLEVGTEGDNGRNNSFGRPLQAAVHVANWHVSDQFVSVNLDRLRIIKSLLKHGADVNGRNTDMEPRWSGARYRRRLVGATAFLFAAKSADVEVMRLLLEHGADWKINTDLNITPLMAAAGISWASNQDKASEAQVLDAVKLLVEELGADVNFVDATGETAMHAAAYRGATPSSSICSTGAKSIVDKVGHAPLRLPKASSAQLVRRAGADRRAAAEARRGALCPGTCPNLMPEEAWVEVSR
jgi:ankyrin repeat protein